MHHDLLRASAWVEALASATVCLHIVRSEGVISFIYLLRSVD